MLMQHDKNTCECRLFFSVKESKDLHEVAGDMVPISWCRESKNLVSPLFTVTCLCWVIEKNTVSEGGANIWQLRGGGIGMARSLTRGMERFGLYVTSQRAFLHDWREGVTEGNNSLTG